MGKAVQQSDQQSQVKKPKSGGMFGRISSFVDKQGGIGGLMSHPVVKQAITGLGGAAIGYMAGN